MTILVKALDTITKVYESASTVRSGKGKFTTVNELTDQVPAARPGTLEAAVQILLRMRPIPTSIDKVLSEEDKGAVLAGLFSVQAGLRLAMARHNVPYEIPGSLVVPLSMEYMDGSLTVNGLIQYDKLIIIDDTLSTGGTLVSLIKAARGFDCHIEEVRVVIEKLGYGGRERLAAEGVDVHAGLGILVDDFGEISVRERLQCPV